MPKLIGKTSIDNIFEKPIVKDILACFEENTRIRFSEIRNNVNRKDELLSRELKEMVKYGILKNEMCPQPKGKPHSYYLLTDKYLTKIHQSRLSWLIDSYSPEDVMDYSKTVFLGLPDEVYRPSKHEVPSESFYDLYIKPEDIFREEPLTIERRKEILKEKIINLIEDYKNKTKAEVLEILKENMLSQINRELSLKHEIPPYEACERIVRKLVEGRNKYRLLLIQHEYDLQLHNMTEGGFKQYMCDYREYFTYKLNLFFMHFFKTGRHLKKDRYEDFENEYDFERILRLFYKMDDFESRLSHFWNMVEKPQMDMAFPPFKSFSKWGIEILKFLSTIVQNVNEQTNDRYVEPITIASTSFTATFAAKEFWEMDDKIRKIIKRGKK